MKTSILCLLLVMLTFSNLPARAQDVPKACELTSLKKYVSEFYEGFKGYSDYSVDHMCVQVNTQSDNVVDSKRATCYNQHHNPKSERLE